MAQKKKMILGGFALVPMVTIAIIALSAAWPAANAAVPSDTLKIIQITDTHICNLTGYHPVFVQKRQHYGNGHAPLKTFFTTIPRQLNADMVVITGDLIDFFQSETTTGELLGTQIEQFAELADFCPVTLLCALGNHDITHYWVDKDSSYSAFRTATHHARSTWIRNLACFKEGTCYSRDYQVGGTRYRLIFLDNGYRAQHLPIPFLIDVMQLHWLMAQLQEHADDVEIVFMHIPLPLPDANGDGIRFSDRSMQLDSMTVAEHPLLNQINSNRSMRLIVTGHEHRNVIEEATFPAGQTITQVETAAFGQSPQNWRMITLTTDEILISQPGSVIIEYRLQSRSSL